MEKEERKEQSSALDSEWSVGAAEKYYVIIHLKDSTKRSLVMELAGLLKPTAHEKH